MPTSITKHNKYHCTYFDQLPSALSNGERTPLKSCERWCEQQTSWKQVTWGIQRAAKEAFLLRDSSQTAVVPKTVTQLLSHPKSLNISNRILALHNTVSPSRYDFKCRESHAHKSQTTAHVFMRNNKVKGTILLPDCYVVLRLWFCECPSYQYYLIHCHRVLLQCGATAVGPGPSDVTRNQSFNRHMTIQHQKTAGHWTTSSTLTTKSNQNLNTEFSSQKSTGFEGTSIHTDITIGIQPFVQIKMEWKLHCAAPSFPSHISNKGHKESNFGTFVSLDFTNTDLKR